MVKIILFDCDGLIIRHEKRFSERLLEQSGRKVDLERQKAFFKNEFLKCEADKADLKEELATRLDIWQWQGTVEQLMDFWFAGESAVEPEMKEYIANLRKLGIKSFLSTNNEKYRTAYLWNKVGLRDVFDGRHASSDIGFLKSEMKFWERVYEDHSSVEKSDILVWDDDAPNVTVAKEFGFQAELYDSFSDFKTTMAGKYLIN